VVKLPAELDIANEREVDSELQSLLTAQHASPLVVDMTETRFCDSAGIAALIRAWRRASVLGACLRVAVSSVAVLRTLRVAGADRLLDIYPGVDAALAADPRAS
jgi:anti-anti-sigma factor